MLLEPTEVIPITPQNCSCGNQHLNTEKMQPFYTHQHIELPPIQLLVTHYVLNQCQCDRCGKTVKAQLTKEQQPGYGPRLTALIAELRLLCHWSKAPPSDKQWTKFYSRFILLLFLYENAEDDAGKLARLLIREMDSLWVFLEHDGVEPTNNRAERALRFGVLWRKRSYGTQSDKGNRWVERILSLKETCRIRSMPSFPVLVDLITCYFKEQQPDLGWI